VGPFEVFVPVVVMAPSVFGVVNRVLIISALAWYVVTGYRLEVLTAPNGPTRHRRTG